MSKSLVRDSNSLQTSAEVGAALLPRFSVTNPGN